MLKVCVDLNDKVYVRLTDAAREQAFRDGYTLANEDIQGRTMFQLHELMNIFGLYLIPGSDKIFQDNALELE